VRLVDPDVRHPWCVCYGVRVFPCDRLTSPDGRRCWRADGVPSVPTGTVGVPEYLHLLHNAQEYLAGRQVGFRDAPASARWANSE
ncbi:MAG: hypothetical protein IT424_11225, partial [Pirellulales bacterium]|nr:hypothetical protein [Pirellulales bacterium]